MPQMVGKLSSSERSIHPLDAAILAGVSQRTSIPVVLEDKPASYLNLARLPIQTCNRSKGRGVTKTVVRLRKVSRVEQIEGVEM